MKYLLYISIFFILTSCGKESACDQVEYSVQFEAQQGEEFCFPDDNSFQITKVNDELCPCNVVCISPGYVSFDVVFTLEGENFSGSISGDLNVDQVLMEPKLPSNYKFIILEQEPDSDLICGGEVKPEDFKFTLKIAKN